MRQLFNILKEQFDSNTEVIMCTVVSSLGSAPRGAGARMLVNFRGVIAGSVGGGEFEYRMVNHALNMLSTSARITPCSCLHRQDLEEAGMICGGETTLVFTYLSPKIERDVEFVTSVHQAFKNKKETFLIMNLNEKSPDFGRLSICDRVKLVSMIPEGSSLKPTIIDGEAGLLYFEKLVSNEYVYIFGGGHVAAELVPLLAKADFDCVVWDDREDFSASDRFSSAIKTICCPTESLTSSVSKDGVTSCEIPDGTPITSNDYVCVMTRGHLLDLEIEEKMLRTDAGYIGVIGSKKKNAYINEELRKKGFSDEDLKRITSPIGLNIHAATPFEIAVSICSELIKLRAEKA